MLTAAVLVTCLTLMCMLKLYQRRASSASCTIPFTSGKQSGCMPGWSEYVAPYKEKSVLVQLMVAVWSA